MINIVTLLHILVIFMLIKTFQDKYVKYKMLLKFITVDLTPSFTLKTPYTEERTQEIHGSVFYNLIDISNFQFLFIPEVCGSNSILLIMVVTSEMKNLKRRNIIRESWGRKSDAVKIVFCLGFFDQIDVLDTELEDRIVTESKVYGDILMGDFVTMMGFLWVARFCPKAKYVLKADDDVFTNTPELIKFLKTQLSPWGAEGLIAGTIVRSRLVLRDLFSKYYVSEKEYKETTYPDYCLGGMTLFSQDVMTMLLKEAQNTTYLHIEDAYVSGIIPENMGLRRTNMTYVTLALYIEPTRALKKIDTLGLGGIIPFVFGPIDLYPDEMIRLGKHLPDNEGTFYSRLWKWRM